MKKLFKYYYQRDNSQEEEEKKPKLKMDAQVGGLEPSDASRDYAQCYATMAELFDKLTVLNYQQEFCSLYKCPPIHKFYFSRKAANQSEQQFIFISLCSWLIMAKCQMNFDLQPEEYEDPEQFVAVVVEALELLLGADEGRRQARRSVVDAWRSQLKQGYGPEVVWALSVLADRALELMLEADGRRKIGERVKLTFKQTQTQTNSSGDGQEPNFIIVGLQTPGSGGGGGSGGGLTTRPIESFERDDPSLLFADSDRAKVQTLLDIADARRRDLQQRDRQAEVWLAEVKRLVDEPQFAKYFALPDGQTAQSLADSSGQFKSLLQLIDEFETKVKPSIDAVAAATAKQLQAVASRESYLHSASNAKLGEQVNKFAQTWRQCNKQLFDRHKLLAADLADKTAQRSALVDKLTKLRADIELREFELADTQKLASLEAKVRRLSLESKELDVRVGLLLSRFIAHKWRQ